MAQRFAKPLRRVVNRGSVTNEQQQNPEYLALLAEEMTPEELRILLQRLGETEFGDPKPTIGAVAEATNTDAIAISKMLRAIRNEHLDEKIEKALGPRDAKIERLEKITDVIEDKIDHRLPTSHAEGVWFSDSWGSSDASPESREILTDMVINEKYRRQGEKLGLWAAGLALLGFLIYIIVTGY